MSLVKAALLGVGFIVTGCLLAEERGPDSQEPPHPSTSGGRTVVISMEVAGDTSWLAERLGEISGGRVSVHDGRVSVDKVDPATAGKAAAQGDRESRTEERVATFFLGIDARMAAANDRLERADCLARVTVIERESLDELGLHGFVGLCAECAKTPLLSCRAMRGHFLVKEDVDWLLDTFAKNLHESLLKVKRSRRAAARVSSDAEWLTESSRRELLANVLVHEIDEAIEVYAATQQSEDTFTVAHSRAITVARRITDTMVDVETKGNLVSPRRTEIIFNSPCVQWRGSIALDQRLSPQELNGVLVGVHRCRPPSG